MRRPGESFADYRQRLIASPDQPPAPRYWVGHTDVITEAPVHDGVHVITTLPERPTQRDAGPAT